MSNPQRTRRTKAKQNRGSPLRRFAKGGAKQGFTLLELLMVVIIIGILASIAVPQYFRVTERSRVAEGLQILATLRGSEIRWRAADPGNAYTTTLANLDITAPVMNSWNAPTATLPNLCAGRKGGVHNNDLLMINIDTGATCASVAGATTDWGLTTTAGACGGC